MSLTYDEKIRFMSNLNWDYLDTYEDMLAVIEGRLESSGAFNRDKLFVRSLERIPWHYVVQLWGVENIKKLYTLDIAKRIWPKSRRCHFDFAVGILRKEPVSPPGWGTEYFKSDRYKFFSDRRHGT